MKSSETIAFPGWGRRKYVVAAFLCRPLTAVGAREEGVGILETVGRLGLWRKHEIGLQKRMAKRVHG